MNHKTNGFQAPDNNSLVSTIYIIAIESTREFQNNLGLPKHLVFPVLQESSFHFIFIFRDSYYTPVIRISLSSLLIFLLASG